MKAIIPVAGIGSRLKPHTTTQPKSLIPVAGKPILGHILDRLIDSGITEFVFIIGHLGDKIEQYITSHYAHCSAEFVIQTLGKGTGHAIWLARETFSDDEPILIVLGDTIFEADLKSVFNAGVSSLGVKKVEDPRQFGVAELEDDGSIRRLVEKPSIPKSNLALVGLYYIRESGTLKQCLEYNIENEIRTQNEFHLTDALQCMMEKGAKITTFSVENWFDCGKKEIILQTNKNLLRHDGITPVSEQLKQSNIIVPPVYIAPTARIENSIIGPDVSVGEHAFISRSIVKNSIIGQNAQLQSAILENSLIGSDSSLTGAVQSMNIGDGAEMNLGGES
jgi:glucose-1-phosphate thymidylyltransferase